MSSNLFERSDSIWAFLLSKRRSASFTLRKNHFPSTSQTADSSLMSILELHLKPLKLAAKATLIISATRFSLLWHYHIFLKCMKWETDVSKIPKYTNSYLYCMWPCCNGLKQQRIEKLTCSRTLKTFLRMLLLGYLVWYKIFDLQDLCPCKDRHFHTKKNELVEPKSIINKFEKYQNFLIKWL